MSFDAQSYSGFLTGLNRKEKRLLNHKIKSKNKKWTPGRSIDHLKPGRVVLSRRQTLEYLKR